MRVTGEPVVRSTLLLTVCLVTAAFAGCADSPGATNEQFTISRQIRIHLDSANIDSESDNPYDYVETAFVVRINGAAIAPAAATIVYQDESGAIVSKPLSAFTDLATLAKGTEVRVGDANLTSSASLLVGGVEVVSRARPHTDWWNVGGYPIGWRMQPGAALGYRTTAAATESFSLTDIRGSADEAKDFVLDKASASFGVKYDGTIDLALASTPSSVVAEKEHSAFPLEWRSAGRMTLPFQAEATGRNLSSGQLITAGIALAPTSGVDFDANGKLWWNVSGSPVRADISGGSWKSQFDSTAWLTGVPELDGTFSCAGKAKAENCRPTEIPQTYTKGNGTFDADSFNLDTFPWDVKPDVVANLTRFLDEDLVPGDELRFDVDIDSSKLKDYEADGGPESFHLTGGAILKAVAFEKVTVAAGTFDALKLVERMDMRFDVGKITDEDGVVLNAFVLEERFVDTTIWLQKDTFVPLRVDQTTPFDLNKAIDAFITNVPADRWTDLPVERLKAESIDATIEATSTLELMRNAPGTSFSPYVGLMTAHFSSPMAGPVLGATAYVWMSGFGEDGSSSMTPYPYDDMGTYDGMYDDGVGHKITPYDPNGGDGYDDGGMGPARDVSLTLASAGPIVGGTQKDLNVLFVSDGVTYGDLTFMLNEEYLGYGEDPGSWCLVDPDTDACVDAMEGYYATVRGEDTLRFSFPGIQGSALSVYGNDEDPITTFTMS